MSETAFLAITLTVTAILVGMILVGLCVYVGVL